MREQHNIDRRPRTLTDADAEAIALALKDVIKQEFYNDLGRGVWALIWKALIAALVTIAAIGAYKSGGITK